MIGDLSVREEALAASADSEKILFCAGEDTAIICIAIFRIRTNLRRLYPRLKARTDNWATVEWASCTRG
jgi:hypothetical protein